VITTRQTLGSRIQNTWIRIIEPYNALLRVISHERLVNGIIIAAVTLATLFITFLYLTDRSEYVPVFIGFVLVVPLTFLLPELGVLVYCLTISSQLMNVVKLATFGASGRFFLMAGLLMVLTFRAWWEYLRIPKEERPRLFSVFTIAMAVFLAFYATHVVYSLMYTFVLSPPVLVRPITPSYFNRIPEISELIKAADWPLAWVMVFPAIVLLRNPVRARRFFIGLGAIILFFSGLMTLEYVAPLPPIAKAVLGIGRAYETEQGYRVSGFEGIHTIVCGSLIMLAFLGIDRRWNKPWAYVFYLLTITAILVNKYRGTWISYALAAPIVLMHRRVTANVRLATAGFVMFVFLTALTFVPPFSTQISRLAGETYDRFMLTFSESDAFGGKGTIGGRLGEVDYVMYHWRSGSTFQQLFGFGLDTPYGYYEKIHRDTMFATHYEKSYIHVGWVAIFYKLGIFGVILTLVLFAAYFIRARQILKMTDNIYVRAFIGAGIGWMLFCLLRNMTGSVVTAGGPVMPFVVIWTTTELLPYWLKHHKEILEPPKEETASAA